MNKNITLSAEEALIQKAREKAISQKKSLNVLFRDWLRHYVDDANNSSDFDQLMKKLSYVNVGSKEISRKQLNERRL